MIYKERERDHIFDPKTDFSRNRVYSYPYTSTFVKKYYNDTIHVKIIQQFNKSLQFLI